MCVAFRPTERNGDSDVVAFSGPAVMRVVPPLEALTTAADSLGLCFHRTQCHLKIYPSTSPRGMAAAGCLSEGLIQGRHVGELQ